MPLPPPHPSWAQGVKPPLLQDAVARRVLQRPLLRSVSVPAEPPRMDVTYAVVNKARRGGGATGKDPTSFEQDPTPLGSSSLPGSPVRHPLPTLAASPQPSDGAYEVVTPHGDPSSSPCLGFNFRIRKPKGPREPPAEWSRV
ncbi:tyrosine-protein phosphatase non-receptor type 18 isoform X1 [Falco biarmicus]|uniref:tyrosine-protein phosphatase non-receptor type 18 isoform X1 n=1 Tax=Falco peregrinus TaxID=8954 RepID=UPI000FFC5A4E|nr:tyrosine-protein phosphatase non-receptor type 18 isoform X1 [Falco peregrinus]XP_027672123.1 tyrosine-protein phosphatase non-receptor type 18 isoform X1 [Falco cherrug]XP_037267438.1 tyrosine-protein phosphatase non-receptor type 18 isoform X1 [Falco rusticolus]XP_056218632.1 tyrosine-protein phosphatase non-receptor type 18 isoform X1 [Falco biarmicus]